MAMHNGTNGCITCYEEGKTVHQEAGYARCYQYKDPTDISQMFVPLLK